MMSCMKKYYPHSDNSRKTAMQEKKFNFMENLGKQHAVCLIGHASIGIVLNICY